MTVAKLGWTEEQRHPDTLTAFDHMDLRAIIEMPSVSRMTFAGFEAMSGRMIGCLNLYWNGEMFEIGGAVLREARSQGYGTKLMVAACHMAHRHFGILDVHAGCETTNTASMRWLAKSGFARAHRTPHHTLSDGRVIDAAGG